MVRKERRKEGKKEKRKEGKKEKRNEGKKERRNEGKILILSYLGTQALRHFKNETH